MLRGYNANNKGAELFSGISSSDCKTSRQRSTCAGNKLKSRALCLRNSLSNTDWDDWPRGNFSTRQNSKRPNDVSAKVNKGWQWAVKTAVETRRTLAESLHSKSETTQRETAHETASTSDREKQPEIDISDFLQPTPTKDLQNIRICSSLTALAYCLDTLTEETLYRHHRLRLVSTSLLQRLHCESAGSLDTDGHGPSLLCPLPSNDSVANAIYSAIEDCEGEAGQQVIQSVTEVAAHLGASQRDSNLPVPSLFYDSTHSDTAFEVPDQNQERAERFAGPLAHAAAAGDSAAAASLGYVTSNIAAAVEPTPVKSKAKSESQCPCEWFVCDDPARKLRVVVVQGSDSLALWRSNLNFDPVEFEEGLDASVHRGAYDATKALYKNILPFILEHLAAHGQEARLCFTGHSIGGSIAMLLAMLLRHRRIAPREAFEDPIYTFGAPHVICSDVCHIDESGSCRSDSALLERLGLRQDFAWHIMLNWDIVPRALTCDYTPVQRLLRRVGTSFRQLGCLEGEGPVMYAALGKTMVLQPEASKFKPHPLMPKGAGLYTIRSPKLTWASVLSDAWDMLVPTEEELEKEEPQTRRATSPKEAFRVMMNSPHPLDILSTRSSYGSTGTISLFHNPNHYTWSLSAVLRRRRQTWTKPLQQLPSAIRQRLPTPPVLSSGRNHSGAAAAAQTSRKETQRQHLKQAKISTEQEAPEAEAEEQSGMRRRWFMLSMCATQSTNNGVCAVENVAAAVAY
ncbi:hypothetical protein CYMTET_45325 [Cymbomonas tetramitiformis]|uniref:Fungal lipase-type domain-containing protein n=1 Tax=Cymbomonas tetramitiformis TaxID=36881 RepID=A0AAE0BZJ4_9CHLO|nr:hypothetical protein CYMTET_45325 [Cymbomonas tetramitiformis]